MDYQLQRDDFGAAISAQRDAKWKRRLDLGGRGGTGGGLERKYLLSRREWNLRYDAECQRFPGKWQFWERDHEAFHEEWSPGSFRLLQHVQHRERVECGPGFGVGRRDGGADFQGLQRGDPRLGCGCRKGLEHLPGE